MPHALFDSLRSASRGKVLADEPLCRHTTWRVGGAADLFLAPADLEDLLGVLALLRRYGVPWLILGAGSNLLVRDGGVRGAVVHLGAFRRLVLAAGGEVLAGGGLPLMTLVRETARQGLAGLEALAGIPGTVGGAVAMNAGAGGREMAEVVREVVLAGPAGVERRAADSLGFAYRRSALSGEEAVVEAVLKLQEAAPALLEAAIGRRLAQRRQSQGVEGPNAGSVFKNPPGHQAWRLIDAAGLRGRQVGGARVSSRHANFIVNAGGARAADILALIETVQEGVRRHSGVVLEPEVRIVGGD